MTVRRSPCVQKPPVLLDLRGHHGRAMESLDEAAAQSAASLVVFPEAYLPGYPTWIWRLRPGGDMALSGDIHARLREQRSRPRRRRTSSRCATGARQHGRPPSCAA